MTEGCLRGGDEVGDESRSFAAGGGFDAAGHIDGVGLHGGDGVANVLRRESAGQDERQIGECCTVAHDERPIGQLATSAKTAAGVGIDEHGVGQGAQPAAFVQIAGERRKAVAAAVYGADDGHVSGELGQEGRRLVAMQLNGVETDPLDKFRHLVCFMIDKDADFRHASGKRRGDLPRGMWINVARTFIKEIQSDGVGTGLNGEARVVDIRDTADLDTKHAIIIRVRMGRGLAWQLRGERDRPSNSSPWV